MLQWGTSSENHAKCGPAMLTFRAQIKEVLSEVRDSNARHVLETLTTELTVREVDPDALKFVTNFSKLTGDFPRLSATDLKVITSQTQLACCNPLVAKPVDSKFLWAGMRVW